MSESVWHMPLITWLNEWTDTYHFSTWHVSFHEYIDLPGELVTFWTNKKACPQGWIISLQSSSTDSRWLYGRKYRNWVYKEHTYLMKKHMHIFVNFCHCHISHVSTLHLFSKDLKRKAVTQPLQELTTYITTTQLLRDGIITWTKRQKKRAATILSPPAPSTWRD